MNIHRNAEEKLRSWKEGSKNALLIKGARQVGKTYLIREFANKEFEHSFEINFASDARANALLLEATDYDDFLARISLLINNPLPKGSLLFLDEIQFYYEKREQRIKVDPNYENSHVDILTLAKSFAEKGEFRLIMSGSLLGTFLFNARLNPMGYLDEFEMHPLDFGEFLMAGGISERILEEINEAFKRQTPLEQSLHEELLKRFKEYLIVGGMPQVVDSYLTKGGFSEVGALQDYIIDWYKRDIIKYAAPEDRPVIAAIYDQLGTELSKQNRKFVKSHLDTLPNFKNLDVSDRFLWLAKAGITIPVYNVTNPVYPLKKSQDSKLVKLFANDTGLLLEMLYEGEEKAELLRRSPELDFGAVYENAAASLLTAHGHRPYFHSLKKNGEVDFIIQGNFGVLPIEIKSGDPNRNGNYAHNALNHLLNNHPEIENAFLFGQTNIRRENERITYFPIYMLDCLRK